MVSEGRHLIGVVRNPEGGKVGGVSVKKKFLRT